MKSLSKGSTSKKDILSSTLNLKESTTLPLSSVLPIGSTFEDDVTDAWAEQDEKDDFDVSEDSYEQEKPIWKENGKPESYNLSTSENKIQKPIGQTKWKDLPKLDPRNPNSDDDLNALLQVILVKKFYVLPLNMQKLKFVDTLIFCCILQEEEDLVNAHRKQVEETMNIVREVGDLAIKLIAYILQRLYLYLSCRPQFYPLMYWTCSPWLSKRYPQAHL